MIKKVIVNGNMIEVQAKIAGEFKTVRRNVADYNTYTKAQKVALWHEIVAEPLVEYQRLNFLRRIFRKR